MLIGLAGYARSGKDTVGAMLASGEHHFHTKAFADLMRASALALNPIVDWSHDRRDVRPIRYSDVLEAVGYERAKSTPEIREFLQRVGTEMGRKVFDADFWVDRTFARMDLGVNWALTDVRFINEAKAIVERGGSVVRINRTGCGPANDHISEHELDDWHYDHVLQNDGTLDELAHLVQKLVAWES